ncbi:hypothetical protein ACF049_19280 [Cellulosimicrobium funkei]|uniref:hypothetical protein n=1 Tax=Cellulosimicrobium funkei TaxID=264251 RepID=UPI003702970E
MKLTYLATRVLTDVTNPLEGITPTLDVFGIEFKGRVSIILGGIWALVLVAAAAAVLLGGGKWAWASKVSHSTEGAMEGAAQFKGAASAFGVIAAASVILGAIIWAVQGN